MPVEPSSDPPESSKAAHSQAHPNLLSRAVESEVSSSVGITKGNKTIRTDTSGASSKGNPDSTSNQESNEVVRDTEGGVKHHLYQAYTRILC